MAEQEGYLEFIESFNHIHKYLKKYTNSDDNVPFSDLIYKAKGHPMINLYLDELHLFRKLRNIIVHQTDNFEQLVATPSDEAVERIKFIEQRLVDPSTVGVFQAEVIKFDMKDSIQEVLKISGEKEILKLPLYDGNQFSGLVTSRAIAKWLQKHIQNNNIELSGTVGELLDFEKKSQYEFIPTSMTIYEAWRLYQTSPKQLDALLLTENRTVEEEIKAVITYDDLLRYIYTHDQYVFN